MIITRTPWRVSFFGGGTDYPAWYRENGGAVLATTINKYGYIICRQLTPFLNYNYNVVYSKLEKVKRICDIQHPSVRECLRYMKIKERIGVHYDADLPAQTGLGSSSSFTVGLLHALYAFKGSSMPTKRQLALDAMHLEQDVLKENVGSQDQVLAAFGGLNLIEFGGPSHIQVQPVTLKAQRLKSFQSHLMLFFTGFTRFASEIAAKQIANIPKRKREMRIMRELVGEGLNILNSNTSLSKFGKLLHESWQIKRTLSRKIATPLVDDIYSAALRAGALGGKLLGAGGGGFMLIFAKPEDQAKIKKKLKKFLCVPFRFEDCGSQIVF